MRDSVSVKQCQYHVRTFSESCFTTGNGFPLQLLEEDPKEQYIYKDNRNRSGIGPSAKLRKGA